MQTSRTRSWFDIIVDGRRLACECSRMKNELPPIEPVYTTLVRSAQDEVPSEPDTREPIKLGKQRLMRAVNTIRACLLVKEITPVADR